jgi:hypothetical protein
MPRKVRAMTDLAGAIQIALYEKIGPAINGVPVVAAVPIGSDDLVQYPFVLLGPDATTEEGGKGTRFERHEVTINVVFQGSGKMAAKAAQEKVRGALHDQAISATGAALSRPRQLHSSLELQEDGVTYVGTQIFLIFAQDDE